MEIDVSEAFSFRCAFLASLLLQRVHLGNLKQNILSRDTNTSSDPTPISQESLILELGTEWIYD